MNHAELIARLRGPWGSLAEGINIAEEAADVLSRLTAGDVSLPEPDVKDWTESASGMTHRRYSHTRAQLQDYGDRRAAAAVLAERERCAKVCQDMKRDCDEPDSMQASLNHQMMSCADAIRKETS
jgi:chemotaxis protein CheY-P-specific phosphatase CheC